MATSLETRRAPATVRASSAAVRPAYQAFLILYAGFVALPILAGLDKFFHVLVNWDQYIAPMVTQIIPVSGHTFMLVVGVIEVAAGVLVAVVTAVARVVTPTVVPTVVPMALMAQNTAMATAATLLANRLFIIPHPSFLSSHLRSLNQALCETLGWTPSRQNLQRRTAIPVLFPTMLGPWERS